MGLAATMSRGYIYVFWHYFILLASYSKGTNSDALAPGQVDTILHDRFPPPHLPQGCRRNY